MKKPSSVLIDAPLSVETENEVRTKGEDIDKQAMDDVLETVLKTA